MNHSPKSSKISPKIAGSIEILISAFWAYHNAETFCEYRAHPELLRVFIIPDSVLVFHFLVGLIGIWCGIEVWRSKWSIKKGYLIFFGLWIIGQILFFFLVGL